MTGMVVEETKTGGGGGKRVSLTKKVGGPVTKKLTIAEEVGKKLKRLEEKPIKEFLDIAMREFDIAVSLQVSELREAFDEALDELRENCNSVEKNIESLLIWKQVRGGGEGGGGGEEGMGQEGRRAVV